MTMKIFIAILLFSLSALAGVKEDMLRVKKEIELELTKERIRVIQKDGDLTNIFNNILRNHETLDRILKRHPEIVKNAKLKEPELTRLKMKLMREDEDMKDLRDALVKLHRKLEEGLDKHESIAELKTRLKSIENRLDRLK